MVLMGMSLPAWRDGANYHSSVIRYNTPVVVVRGTGDGEVRLEMKAVVDANKLFLPVDADIEAGDRVEQWLPNGKLRTMHISKVDVFESPFGSKSLDHTEADYTTSPVQKAPAVGHTFHVQATNVQVATGDRSKQTMTVGQTAEQVVLVMQGITEMLGAMNLADGREAELMEVQQAAAAEITSDKPTLGGVRQFYNWVIDCVKQGGTPAVVAAVTAASSALLHDADALVGAITA